MYIDSAMQGYDPYILQGQQRQRLGANGVRANIHSNAATETSGAVSNSRQQLRRVPFGSGLLPNPPTVVDLLRGSTACCKTQQSLGPPRGKAGTVSPAKFDSVLPSL